MSILILLLGILWGFVVFCLWIIWVRVGVCGVRMSLWFGFVGCLMVLSCSGLLFIVDLV